MKLFKLETNFTIRSKMVIMFLIVILPLFAASIILLVNMRSIIADKSLNNAMSNADSLRTRISDIVQTAETTADKICSNTTIISFLNNHFTDETEYYNFYANNRIIHDYLAVFPQIESIRIFVNRDDFVYNIRFSEINDGIKSSMWYREVLAGHSDNGRWKVITDSVTGEFYLSFIKPMYSSDRRLLGIAVIAISDEWIGHLLSNESYNAVFALNNGMVFHSSIESISKGSLIVNNSEVNAFDPNLREIHEDRFLGYEGYTIVENFTIGETEDVFQIFLKLPYSAVNKEVNQLSLVYGGYCGLMLILSLLTIILFTSVFTRRIHQLSDTMHSVAQGNFDADFTISGNDEINILFSDLDQMVKSIQKLMDDVYRAEIQNEAFKFNQMEAEFKALASQINPHFLYNTLETIRMKAYCNNDKETADLVKKLGKFMRRCLEFKDGEVTLRSELEFTNSYLELQSARFGDRVSYSIYSEVDKDYMILPLIIQPLVENAFVHGIEGCKTNGHIDIKVYYHKENVVIDVRDNGQGISPEKMAELEEKLRLNDTSSGKSIGLTNVNKRVKMYHGEQYGMTVQSVQGKGTTIRVTLPRVPAERAVPAIGLQAVEKKELKTNV
ncbi:MAG: sensor histidine kinase [Huintestinicola sp.]